jgi:nucleoside-diphosphate-sugar epimerase
VLVTGATGFLATHCIKLLQDEGWRVRGTVRNLKDEGRTSALYELAPSAKHKLELVEADLTKPDTWPAYVNDHRDTVRSLGVIALISIVNIHFTTISDFSCICRK